MKSLKQFLVENDHHELVPNRTYYYNHKDQKIGRVPDVDGIVGRGKHGPEMGYARDILADAFEFNDYGKPPEYVSQALHTVMHLDSKNNLYVDTFQLHGMSKYSPEAGHSHRLRGQEAVKALLAKEPGIEDHIQVHHQTDSGTQVFKGKASAFVKMNPKNGGV